MYCGKCGSKLDKRTGHCPKCGKSPVKYWLIVLALALNISTLLISFWYIRGKEIYQQSALTRNPVLAYGKNTKLQTPTEAKKEPSVFPLRQQDKRKTFDVYDGIVAIREDGTVVVTGYGDVDVSNWAEMVEVAAIPMGVLGLRADGTVRLALEKEWDPVYDWDKQLKETTIWKDWKNIRSITAGPQHIVGLKEDGTVVACGNNSSGECDVEDWNDIVSVASGFSHTVGLKSNGTVVAVGDNSNGQCNVAKWTDIVAIAADVTQTVGLKSDGSVVAVGGMTEDVCNTPDWTDIISISTGQMQTIGLKSNGTIVSTRIPPEGWSKNDIVEISAGRNIIVGLQKNGSVIVSGDVDVGQYNVKDWTNISKIWAGECNTIAQNFDGSIKTVGSNFGGQLNTVASNVRSVAVSPVHIVYVKENGSVVASGNNDVGQCNVDSWEDVVSVAASTWSTVGVKSDGTIITTKYDLGWGYLEEAEKWDNIISVELDDYFIAGLKADGTVVSAPEPGSFDVSGFRNITQISAGNGFLAVLSTDGRVTLVHQYKNDYEQLDWSNIVAIAAGGDHTVGLKSDGSVVAIGDNRNYQCDVSEWTDIISISASEYNTVGLKSDGTVVVTEHQGNPTHYYMGGHLGDVTSWTDIRLPC